MENNPLKAQSDLVRSFGRSAASGLKSMGAAMPKAKKVDTSKWSSLLSGMSGGRRGYSGATESSVTTGITDKGADLRRLGPTTTRFGGSTRGESRHPGVDTAMPIGRPIPALRSGTVVKVDSGHRQGESRSYGNRVGVKDAVGNVWYYSHLDRSWVQLGQKVAVGQNIGAAGNTGSTYSQHGGTGSHLDLRVVSAYNRFVDPRYLGIKY